MLVSGVFRLAGPENSGGNPGGDDSGGQGAGHDRAGPHDRLWANVSHDDGGAADPGTGADPDQRPNFGLIPDQNVEVGEPVRPRSARNMNPGGQQSSWANGGEADMAHWSNISSRFYLSASLGEDRPELDHGRAITSSERPHQKCSTEILARQPREPGQRLTGPLQSAITTEAETAKPERDQSGTDHQEREGASNVFGQITSRKMVPRPLRSHEAVTEPRRKR